MRGDTLAVVVANRHHEELGELADDRALVGLVHRGSNGAGGGLAGLQESQAAGHCTDRAERQAGQQADRGGLGAER